MKIGTSKCHSILLTPYSTLAKLVCVCSLLVPRRDAVCVGSPSILTAALDVRTYYHPHFTEQKENPIK